MMFFGCSRTFCVFVVSLSILLLLIAPDVVYGQFGVGNRKQKENTKFQELQEMAAKQQQGGGGGLGGGGSLADMQKMMADALKDPKAMEDTMNMFGSQFNTALEQMMQMSPDELQNQLQQAMKLMADGDIVNTVLSQREEVLKTLEATGSVPPEELAKYKADPEYFELKMRESFTSMQEIFTNPEYLAQVTEAVGNMKEFMSNPQSVNKFFQTLGSGEWTSDEKIEEARLQFLKNGGKTGVPALDEIFQTEEMQSILSNPLKWKQTVKEGFEDMMNMGITGDTPTTGTGGMKDEL